MTVTPEEIQQAIEYVKNRIRAIQIENVFTSPTELNDLTILLKILLICQLSQKKPDSFSPVQRSQKEREHLW